MKVGILGFAHGHVSTYITQWQQHPELDIQVVCGWDHDAARLAQCTDNFGLEKGECPYCVVNDPEVKAVIIGTETANHAELVEIAAAAGKAIVVQKPLALTIADANRIVKAVKDANVPFTVAWQMHVDPQNLKIRELMESGVLGKLFHFQRRHNLGMCLNHENMKLWHFDPVYNRNIWADDAAHPIDLVYWLFGMPESVTAEIGTLHDADMPCDNGVAIFRYKGGPIVEVSCSFSASAVEKTTEIIGEKGYLVQCYGDAVSAPMPRCPEDSIGLKYYLKAEKKWYDSGIPSPVTQGVRIGALAKPLSEFLHGEREAISTAEASRDSLRMVLATFVSSESGRRVSPQDSAIDNYPAPVAR